MSLAIESIEAGKFDAKIARLLSSDEFHVAALQACKRCPQSCMISRQRAPLLGRSVIQYRKTPKDRVHIPFILMVHGSSFSRKRGSGSGGSEIGGLAFPFEEIGAY